MTRNALIDVLLITFLITACYDNSSPVPAAIKEDSNLNVETSTAQSNQIETITAGSMDSDSRDFIVKAATSNFMDISKAEAALKQADNSSLKNFSKTIVDEHTQLNIKLKKIVQSNNFAFPEGINSSKQNEIDVLNRQQGKIFDNRYVNDMIENCQADIQYYTKASTGLENADLKSYAANALPILLKDLEALKAIKSDLK